MSKRVYDIQGDQNSNFLYQNLNERIDPVSAERTVKTASSQPRAAFAWPERRLFPIFDAESTATSCLYLDANDESAGIPEFVRDNVKTACVIHGVEIQTFEKIAAELSPEEDYLIPEERLVLCNSPENVKVAEAILREQRGDMEFVTLAYAYSRLDKKAREFNVKLASDSESYLGTKRCNVRLLMSSIRDRQDYIQDENVKLACDHLIGQLRDYVGFAGEILDDMDSQTKLAQTLHELDVQAEITGRYGEGNLRIDNPIKAVFNDKYASDEVFNIGGHDISMEQLAGMDPDMVSSIMGDDYLEDVQETDGSIDPQEMAQALQIMPADLQQEVISQFF